MLVRGFSNSPRFMIALLSDFFLRWNQNIEVTVRGLHKKYDGIFEGSMIEDEIEKMAMWEGRVAPPHPEWSSTKNVESTGEVFGLIDPLSNMEIDSESEDDESLIEAAEMAAEQVLELELDVDYDA